MRLPIVIVLAAVTTAAVGPDARAIWLPPDIVQIPTERLVANLEKTLGTAPPESKVGVLLQLARLHAAAYAHKTDTTPVVNPLRWSTRPATIVGPHVDRDVRGAIGYLTGRGGNLLEPLRQPRDYDARYGCDARAVAKVTAVDGEIVVGFRLPKGKKGEESVAAREVKVIASTVKDKAVGACLAARIAEDASFPAKDGASTVTLAFEFATTGEAAEPHFGFGDYTVPHGVQPDPDDARAVAEARAHLGKARARYEEIITLAPGHALAQLGLAWTLEQEGRVDEAVAAYRRAFREAWAKESSLTHLGLGSRPIAAEAASYLLARLDRDKDAAEIAELEAAQQRLVMLPRPVTPLVVPLVAGASLASLVDATSAVRFDLDGSGVAREWGWVGADAALLVWDPARSGQVTSGLQLFGSVSWWAFWQTGYEALAALDDDGDGQVAGAELAGLALWRDGDGDGVSDPGEVRPVADWGVVALGTRARIDAGVPWVERGAVFADGAARPTWDWTPTSRRGPARIAPGSDILVCMETETDIGGRARGPSGAAPALRLVESASVAGQALVDLRIPIPDATPIGRSPGDAGLTIADARMSGRHVTVFPGAGGALYYLDHESKNGTFVNGQRGTTGRLWEGDVLRCGTTMFVVVSGAGGDVDEEPTADRVGLSPRMQSAWARARAAAAHDVPVLVLGPTGSGKEGVARLVHEASGRRGPWLAVNCAALGGDTATAALFGHERGAFTGAVGASKGCFREAEGGTLFLDEIGDLPIDVQPRLLRALEQKEIVPVGASRPARVDVRLVAATNADLSAKILDHRFRADLYARLAAWIIELPGLAARREDVLRLARHFAGRSPGRRSALDDAPLFDVELAERLLLHPWPYNVRELRQLVLGLRVSGPPPWDVDDLPPGFGAAATMAPPGEPAAASPDLEDTLPESRRRARPRARPERAVLVAALERHGFNVAAVARQFERDRKQIYRWAELYQIPLHDDDAS